MKTSDAIYIISFGMEPFKRKIYSKLLDFKHRNGEAALLIEGARRIGKTTVLEEFGKREYKSYIRLDFEKHHERATGPFDELPDLNRFFQFLMANYNTRLYPRDSLIVFDEVQLFPKARQAIKELVADGRYDYIETGSLISIQKNVTDILLPSEEENLKMYPLDFEEFLTIRGKDMLVEQMRQAYQTKTPLIEGVHQKILKEFWWYMFVGGMPKPNAYDLEGKPLLDVERQKKLILDLYKNDSVKLDKMGSVRASALLESLPFKLQSNAKTFKASSIFDNNQIDKTNTVSLLADSMMVNVCYALTAPSPDMNLYKNPNKFQIYMNDVGLLNTMIFQNGENPEEEITRAIANMKLSTNKGYLYENVAAELIRSSGKDLYKYIYSDPEKKKPYEIDFVIRRKDKLVPIEVKSSSSKNHRSLDYLCQKFPGFFAKPVILSNANLHIEADCDYYPIYMAHLFR